MCVQMIPKSNPISEEKTTTKVQGACKK